jgi:hypothetical protein
LWITGGDRDAVMAVMIFFQVYILVATGILVLILVWQTTQRRLAVWFASLLFVGGLAYEFKMCFQILHDSGIVMLALTLVVTGFCLTRPLGRWAVTVGWGIVGGIVALINPIVALAWGVLSLIAGVQQRAWSRLGLAVFVSVLVLIPWTVRNYLVFGRLIPVKSNLAYELYQSQCLQPDGLIQRNTFSTHPYGSPGKERQEYKRLGEMAFLDVKSQVFWQSVRNDPLEFIDRVACRFLGTTLWYVPFERNEATRRPVVFWISRCVHPLPFLALLFLSASAVWVPLHRAQWTVMAVYLLYLLPYIVASYYERYGVPLLGVKVVLVTWAAIRLVSLFRSGTPQGVTAVTATAVVKHSKNPTPQRPPRSGEGEEVKRQPHRRPTATNGSSSAASGNAGGSIPLGEGSGVRGKGGESASKLSQ